MIRDPRPDAAQAAADAEAKLIELHRRTRTLELTLPSNPTLLAESPLQIRGWGSAVDGPWIVNRVSHVVAGNSGYTTEGLRLAGPGKNPRVGGKGLGALCR